MDKYRFGIWYATFSEKIFEQKQIKNIFYYFNQNITINTLKVV